MTNTHGSPPAQLTIRTTTPADHPVLERLWLLFRHDMSEVSGALPDPSGQFRRERLDAAFTDPGWRGVLAGLRPGSQRSAPPGTRLSTLPASPETAPPGLRDDGTSASPVGFALVRGVDAPTRVLSSFFVVRGARRIGVGRELAAHVLASFPGRWEIAFQDANPPAVRFWREVATDAVGPAWTEEHRAVPGRPDLPPDTWITFTNAQ